MVLVRFCIKIYTYISKCCLENSVSFQIGGEKYICILMISMYRWMWTMRERVGNVLIFSTLEHSYRLLTESENSNVKHCVCAALVFYPFVFVPTGSQNLYSLCNSDSVIIEYLQRIHVYSSALQLSLKSREITKIFSEKFKSFSYIIFTKCIWNNKLSNKVAIRIYFDLSWVKTNI